MWVFKTAKFLHWTNCWCMELSLLMLTFPHCPGSNILLSKSIFHSSCSVMSCNHLVRFWLQYIFYYFVCVFLCFSSLCHVSMCVCVLVGLSRIMYRFYVLFLPYGQLSVVCSLSVQLIVIATACDCWLLEQNKMKWNEMLYNTTRTRTVTQRMS